MIDSTERIKLDSGYKLGERLRSYERLKTAQEQPSPDGRGRFVDSWFHLISFESFF
jgi:hypothetical protein